LINTPRKGKRLSLGGQGCHPIRLSGKDAFRWGHDPQGNREKMPLTAELSSNDHKEGLAHLVRLQGPHRRSGARAGRRRRRPAGSGA
jgi:hypothetical protein